MLQTVIACSFFGCTLFAQQIFTNSSVNINNGEIRATFSSLDGNLRNVVTGAPFSADRLSEHTQTLADGTHIRQDNSTEHIARDSQGRTRIERPLLNANQGMGGIAAIQIFDPVAGVGYILDQQNKVAHRVPMQAVNAPPPPPMRATGGGGGGGGSSIVLGSSGIVATGSVISPNHKRPTSTHENLGEQTIEGVVAEGSLSSTTWPVGSQGNDRPITNTNESWFSRELKMAVLTKNSSLQFGEQVTKLINISRAEPDASLFQPPPDYTVVDDKDTVTLNLKRQ
jgi:hypothetical protein